MNIGKLAKLISRRVLPGRFFFSRVLIPLGVLSFYFVSFSWLLPEGVNKAFVTGSGKYVIPITIFLYVAFFAINGSRRVKQQLFITSRTKLYAGDLLLLLLPLTPIIQYILSNDDILSRFESILVFCAFVLFVSLPILVIPILIRNTGSTRPVMSLGLAFTFSITNMASMSRQFAWHEAGSLNIQLAVFGSVWLVIWLLFHLNYRNLLYIMVIVYFSTNSIFQLYDQDVRHSIADLEKNDNRLVKLIDSREPVVTPSIYLLGYDAYVVNETMLGYGIDNRVQEQYLEDLDFQIYPHTYSVGASTIHTMSRVLNVSVDYYGNERKGISGDGIVQNLLKEFGYKTYGVFGWDGFFHEINPSYDHSFPRHSSSEIVLHEAILEGEFRFDIDFDMVSVEQFREEKDSIFSEVSEDPKFIYTHSLLPVHSQNSGACLPNEVELYGERLARANIEMRQDVEMIIENDPKAIVIVAGDHGPYLTKNCFGTEDSYDISDISRLDIQDRFGTFLAIRWPTEDYEEYDDITVLQDLFSVIFAYIFEDPELLEAKVEPVTLHEWPASGAAVVDGVIEGGINNGEPLFTGGIE